MTEKKHHHTTTFQLSYHLHTKLKMMCTLTKKSMGEFIRLAIIKQINDIEIKKPNGK